MLHNMDIRKLTVLGLLALHIVWIGNHMRLVANDQINPWRLGGYAMYTVPNLSLRMQVYDASFPDMPIEVNRLKYELALRFTNATRTFRCANESAAALRAFFDENSTLIGRQLVLVYSERRFVRVPPSTKRQIQGMVIVTWQDERSFTFTNRFCGREVTESATLS